jgi:hypothetical protein
MLKPEDPPELGPKMLLERSKKNYFCSRKVTEVFYFRHIV